MTAALSESIAFFRENDLKTILARIRARDVPGLVQFGLYSLCGGFATATFLVVVVALSKTVIPAYSDMKVATDPLVHFLGYSLFWPAPSSGAFIILDHDHDNIRALNLFVNNCIGFSLANVVGYISNILIVFKTGKHHPVMEFIYFTVVSGTAFLISQIAGPWLVKEWGVPTNIAILTNLLTAMMLNFAGRKFFVFKG